MWLRRHRAVGGGRGVCVPFFSSPDQMLVEVSVSGKRDCE